MYLYEVQGFSDFDFIYYKSLYNIYTEGGLEPNLKEPVIHEK